MGLVSEPIRLNMAVPMNRPMTQPRMIRQEAIRLAIRITAAMAIARVDVSPMEPGMFPRNRSP